MNLTEDHLRAVGEALYGPSWQTPLSEALQIADRTVRRWASGATPVPEGVWVDIAKLCRQRGAALDRWSTKIAG